MPDLKVIDIYPKDMFVKIEISKTGVESLLNFLNKCNCKYDSVKEPEVERAVMYVKNEFFPFLEELERTLSDVT